jgi:hypothetical protein
MRGLVTAALAAIVTLSGCVQPPPQSSVAEPASDAPPAAVVGATPSATAATPAAAPTSEAPPADEVQPTPSATTASPVAAQTSEVPPAAGVPPAPAAAPASSVTADTSNHPTAAPPALPQENASAVQPSEPPATFSPVNATASSPEESIIPATPPVAVSMPLEPPTSPELDLAGLEQRLRETRAIGVFTKLSLKNQVDDLLNQFRGFYQGQIKIQLAELRERYELLLLKVLSLLQDADQELAQAITASREAIWGILTDPQKLATI